MKGLAARIQFDWTWRHGILGLLLIAFALPGPLSAGESTNPTAAQRLVDEALLAEVAGDAAQRTALLREALYFAPQLQAARWHSGQIQIGDQWQTVEDAQKAAAADSVLAEYRALREKLGDSGEGQLELARWCRRNNLDQEAQVHWSNVLAVQPRNEEAQRALGMRWFADRLRTHAEIKEIKAERRAARDAAKRWASQIAKWNRALSGSDEAAKDAALAEIRALKDADVIPVIEGETLGGRLTSDRDIEQCQQLSLAFVEALDRMPDHAATQSLVRYAVLSEIPEVQYNAVNALKKRPLHDYVPMLLDGLTMPIESSFRITSSSGGTVQYRHSLYREGAVSDWSAAVSQIAQVTPARRRTSRSDESDPIQEVARSQRVASLVTRSQVQMAKAIMSTEKQVASLNRASAQLNERLASVLTLTTCQELGPEPRPWWTWWQNYNEVYVPSTSPVSERPEVVVNIYVTEMMSCFAKGTLVWTKTGKQPIESLQIGDLVLAKNPSSGELAYKPILGTTLRPPCPMLRMKVGAEELTTTLGHPVWVSGAAWQMAKELKAGAILHGVEGPVTIEQIDPADEAEAYNLIVADFSTYFVGESGILVHDNTPRKPTLAKVPGLVAAE